MVTVVVAEKCTGPTRHLEGWPETIILYNFITVFQNSINHDERMFTDVNFPIFAKYC